MGNHLRIETRLCIETHLLPLITPPLEGIILELSDY